MIRERDWSLHQKGERDQRRHRERLKAAIRDHLDELITEETITSGDGRARLRVPAIEEPSFRFDRGAVPRIGQGGGRDGASGDGGKGRAGGTAGDTPGRDVLEDEIGVDDVAEVMGETFRLPGLRPSPEGRVEGVGPRLVGRSPVGLRSRIDRRRTVYESLVRRAFEPAGSPTLEPADFRFRTFEERPREETRAVVIAVRDVSGSMGALKKELSRTFFFWAVRLLRRVHPDLDLVFVCHHTQAREVDEETFFHLAESGGTKVSSAYALALRIIEERYRGPGSNVYILHFSDGDNWGQSDNRRARHLLEAILPRVNLFAYAEVRDSDRPSTLMEAFDGVSEPRMRRLVMHGRQDVLGALRSFFGEEGGEAG